MSDRYGDSDGADASDDADNDDWGETDQAGQEDATQPWDQPDSVRQGGQNQQNQPWGEDPPRGQNQGNQQRGGNQRRGQHQPSQQQGGNQPRSQNQPSQPRGGHQPQPGPGGPGRGPNQHGGGHPAGPRISLDVGDALSDGFERFLTYTGAIFVALVAIQQLVTTVATNVLLEAFYEYLATELNDASASEFQSGEFGREIGLTIPVPTEVALVLYGLAFLAGIVIQIGALRALMRPVPDLDSVTSDVFTKKIAGAFFSLLVAEILAGIAIVIGLLFFVLPGIFLILSFWLMPVAVAVENEGPIESLRRSWRLSSGNRFQILALIIVIAIISFVVGMPVNVVAATDPAIGNIVQTAINAVTGVFGYAVLIEAFLQLRGDK